MADDVLAQFKDICGQVFGPFDSGGIITVLLQDDTNLGNADYFVTEFKELLLHIKDTVAMSTAQRTRFKDMGKMSQGGFTLEKALGVMKALELDLSLTTINLSALFSKTRALSVPALEQALTQALQDRARDKCLHYLLRLVIGDAEAHAPWAPLVMEVVRGLVADDAVTPDAIVLALITCEGVLAVPPLSPPCVERHVTCDLLTLLLPRCSLHACMAVFRALFAWLGGQPMSATEPATSFHIHHCMRVLQLLLGEHALVPMYLAYSEATSLLDKAGDKADDVNTSALLPVLNRVMERRDRFRVCCTFTDARERRFVNGLSRYSPWKALNRMQATAKKVALPLADTCSPLSTVESAAFFLSHWPSYYAIRQLRDQEVRLRQGRADEVKHMFSKALASNLRALALRSSREQLSGNQTVDYAVRKTSWASWVAMADQMAALFAPIVDQKEAKDTVVDFAAVMADLAVVPPGGVAIADNGIGWAILQCLDLEHVTTTLKAEGNENLFTVLLGFFQPLSRSLKARDCCFHTVISKREKFHSPRAPPVEQLNQHFLLSRGPEYESAARAAIHEANELQREWKVKKKTDIFNLDDARWQMLCFLSNSSNAQAQAIVEELTPRKAPDKALAYKVAYSGHPLPLETAHLAALSNTTRIDLIKDLKNMTLNPQSTQSRGHPPRSPVASPSIVETYARLLCVTPNSNPRFYLSLLNGFRKCDGRVTVEARPGGPRAASTSEMSLAACHTVLELLNYRLTRCILHMDIANDVFQLVAPMAAQTNHRQLFRSTSHFIMKMAYYVDAVQLSKSSANSLRLNCGEAAKRTLVYGIAETLQTTGVSNLSDLERLLRPVISLDRLYAWPKRALKYFPAVMREWFPSSPVLDDVNRPVTLADAEGLLSADKELAEKLVTQGVFSAPSINMGDPLVENYRTPDPLTKDASCRAILRRGRVLMCAAWLTAWQDLKWKRCAIILRNVAVLMENLSAVEQVNATYDFIDFICDGDVQNLQDPAVVRTVCDLVGIIVWEHFVFDCMVVLRALSERLDCDLGVAALRYLTLGEVGQAPSLFTDQPANATQYHHVFRAACVEFLKDASPHTRWHDNNFAKRTINLHTCYPAKPQERRTWQSWPQADTLPIYYGHYVTEFAPLLHFMICRTLEGNRLKEAISLARTFGDIYAFHDTPLRSVARMLVYFAQCPALEEAPTARLELVVALIGKLMRFTGPLQDLTKLALGDFRQPSLYRTFIDSVVSVMSEQMATDLPMLMFEEMPSVVVSKLTCTSIELMIIPLPPAEIGKYLVDVAFEAPAPTSTEAERTHWRRRHMSAATILTTLPSPFHTPLFDRIVKEVSTSPLLMDEAGSAIFPSGVGDLAVAMQSEQASWTHLAALFGFCQTFFRDCHVDALRSIPTLVRATRPAQSLAQPAFFCHLVMPIMHRLGAAFDPTLGDFLAEVVMCVGDATNAAASQPAFPLFNVEDDSVPPPSAILQDSPLLDVIVDTVHHCWLAFQMPTDSRSSVVLAINSIEDRNLRKRLGRIGD